jgi:hypothetical protein
VKLPWSLFLVLVAFAVFGAFSAVGFILSTVFWLVRAALLLFVIVGIVAVVRFATGRGRDRASTT